MSINSFNSLLDKAISVANVAGKKTEEMVEASKLKIQEVSVNADLANCYEKIGSLVYSARKLGTDNELEISELVEQADALLEQLAQLQAKREEIRKVKKCPNCGASCATDAHFCSRCGMVLQEETSVVAPEAARPEPAKQPEATEQQPSSEPEQKDEEPLIEEKL